MQTKIKILHLEDMPTDAELVARELKKNGIDADILVVPDKDKFVKALKTFSPNVILSDHSLAAFDSHEALRLVKAAGVRVPFILVTATMNDEFAARVIMEGACDYILKDRLNRLPAAIINSIEKKKLQDEQQLIHEKLLFHIEHTPLGYIEFDEQLRLTTISKKANEILGWKLSDHSRDELNVYHLVYEEDWDWLNNILLDLEKGKSKRDVLRVRNIRNDLTVIWCEWFISVMKSETGTTFMTMIQDVTENEAAERRLEASDKSLKEAQSIAHIGNWEIDLVNESEIWSDELYQLLGAKKTMTPSKGFFLSFVHPDDLRACLTVIEEVKDNSMDLRLLTENGTVKHVFSKWKFEFDEANTPIRMSGILQDITERKMAEIERIKLVNDLVLRNTELEQFAYIISHNLRAPVANIIGASCVLEFPELSKEEKETLTTGINSSVKKLDDVITDLNHILQVKDRMDGNSEIVNFAGLVNDIKDSVVNLYINADVEIKFNFDAVNEYLTLKPYLYSVFYNLITNSIKYRKKDAQCTIEIESRIVGNHIELSFRDNGIGINLKKNGDQLFGLYKKFHAGIEGKGMGLFMVKTVVEALGGKISARGGENEGMEFLIELEIR